MDENDFIPQALDDNHHLATTRPIPAAFQRVLLCFGEAAGAAFGVTLSLKQTDRQASYIIIAKNWRYAGGSFIDLDKDDAIFYTEWQLKSSYKEKWKNQDFFLHVIKNETKQNKRKS